MPRPVFRPRRPAETRRRKIVGGDRVVVCRVAGIVTSRPRKHLDNSAESLIFGLLFRSFGLEVGHEGVQQNSGSLYDQNASAKKSKNGEH